MPRTRLFLLALVLNLISLHGVHSRGVVAAASPEAAAAGREILDMGGNAVDAAVAVAFSLCVTEPAATGLFAGIQMLVQGPGMEPIVINGTTYAPKATPPGVARSEIEGHRATTVPTMVRVLETAWREHGSGRVSWADLIAPAIRSAEEGFVLTGFRHRVLSEGQDRLWMSPSGAALALLADMELPPLDSPWKQPALARTLRRIATDGADAFFRGDIARQIAADMAANGGWLSYDDLANLPPPPIQPALRGSYRGWEIATLNPPASGWVVLQVLNILEHRDPAELAPGSPTRDRIIAEALMLAHTSNHARPVHSLADPESFLPQHLSKESASRMRIEPARREGGETTHFSVADRDGLIVAATSSINNFYGAAVGSVELGLFYNDYMVEFTYGQPGHPFAVDGGQAPYSSMSAIILSRDGKPGFGAGSPGSRRIISAVSQVTQLWADGQADIATAVDTHRWHTSVPESLFYEGPARKAHAVADHFGWQMRGTPGTPETDGRHAYFGGVHAVAFEEGRWTGAADPRRDGAVDAQR